VREQDVIVREEEEEMMEAIWLGEGRRVRLEKDKEPGDKEGKKTVSEEKEERGILVSNGDIPV
jgi:hypothetical protein